MASSFECARGEGAASLPSAAGRDASVSRPENGPEQGFPANRRLTARRQFLAVYARGHRVPCPSFTLFGLQNDVGHARLGVTVTRKLGGAVARNRVKRVLREIFRRNGSRLESALDVVVNARPGIVARPIADLEREFLKGFARLAGSFSR